MKTYIFDKKLSLYLYGINRYSEKFIDILKGAGFNVQGFIDKRAAELNYRYHNNRVFDLSVSLAGQNTCVIITLQNALNHETVATELAKDGFNKILFLPLNLIYTSYAREMCNSYNKVVYLHDFSETRIAYWDTFRSEYESGNTRAFRISDNWFLMYVPFTMVYTAFEEDKAYADRPILMFSPYRELFDYLAGKTVHIENYLGRYGRNSCNYTNGYTDNYVLEQRQKLFDIWETHYYFHDGYFEAGAPIAVWNDKGYFNLKEGQHRILYLLLKGDIFVPIRVDKENYRKSIDAVNRMAESKTIREWQDLLEHETANDDWMKGR